MSVYLFSSYPNVLRNRVVVKRVVDDEEGVSTSVPYCDYRPSGPEKEPTARRPVRYFRSASHSPLCAA